MPAYGSAGWPKALNVGDNVQLITAADATAANVTNTAPVAIAPSPISGQRTLTIVNTTNQQAQGKIAASDALANYESAPGFAISAGASLTYNLGASLLIFNFATAPSSGLLTVIG
jgi:hypothetical protein